jgi:hypothetical protein
MQGRNRAQEVSGKRHVDERMLCCDMGVCD